MKTGIILPARNAKKWIENCLTTLNAQTVPVSIYIVDDASDDGMYEFLLDRPTWYTDLERNTERMGWAPSLNRAASMAIKDGCKYLFTMSADDFLRLDCIEKCIQALQGHDWVVVYSQQIGEENVVQASKEHATIEDFRNLCPIVNYGLIPTNIWLTVDGYPIDMIPDSYGFKEDWQFWIEVLQHGYNNYAVVKEPVYYYVMHDGQLHKRDMDRYEEVRKLIQDKYFSSD